MDEMNAFERQLARVARQKVRPLPPADVEDVVRRAVSARPARWLGGMWRATSLAAAAAFVIFAGGFLLASLLGDEQRDSIPAQTPSPSVSAAPSTATDATAARRLVVAQDGSGEYTTIAEAIDAATDGDSIVIRPGTYEGAIIVDKDISIVGDGPRDAIVVRIAHEPDGGGPWIRFDGDTPYAFWIRAQEPWIQERAPSTVSIADLTISADGLPECPDDERRQDCAVAFAVDGGTLELDRVETVLGEDFGSSLYSVAGGEITVRESTLEGALTSSTQLSEVMGLSLGVLKIERSELTGPIDAKYLSLRASVVNATTAASYDADRGVITIRRDGVVQRNVIVVPTAVPIPAIRVKASADAIVRENRIQAKHGVRFEPGGTGEIDDNTLDVTGVGIALGGETVGANRNTVEGGEAGIEVFEDRPWIGENTVTGSGIGLRARGSTAHPEVWCNDFTGNAQEVVVESGASANILPVDHPDDCENAALHLAAQGNGEAR